MKEIRPSNNLTGLLASFRLYLLTILLACFVFSTWIACNSPEGPVRKKKDYIKVIEGRDQTLSSDTVQRGKVLIAYSDCFNCHSIDRRAKGPAFSDIAKRYPTDTIYINMLAHRIINGGSGAWGTAIMDPHPKLSVQDAKTMVSYILSLDRKYGK